MTARGVAAHVARLRRELSERDVAVLESLYRLRLLKTNHVRRLHVAHGSLGTQERRARALLTRLLRLRLIVRLGRQVGGVRAGSSGYVFGLSGLGLAVLDLPSTYGKRRRRIWETKPYHVDHVLAVAEIYVRTVEVCRGGEADLLAFDAEPACWRRFPGPGGEMVVLKPDAFVEVAVGDYSLATFAEVDMGTESLPTIRRKSSVYVDYWQTGNEQQKTGLFPRVLWLVPDQRRLRGIAGVLERFAAPARDLFSVTLADLGPTIMTTLPADMAVRGGQI